jgi:C4-dicarboxylate-specific signal transduction histidine kinase
MKFIPIFEAPRNRKPQRPMRSGLRQRLKGITVFCSLSLSTLGFCVLEINTLAIERNLDVDFQMDMQLFSGIILNISKEILSMPAKPTYEELTKKVKALKAEVARMNKVRQALKEREGELFRAQQLEPIGKLAGGIAHDFNNLLMGIQANTSLMLFDIQPGHPHHERLKNIEQLVQSGANLTKQLLGFARGGKYHVKPIDPNEVLDKTSSLFGRTKKEIRIYHKLQTDKS